MSVDPAIAQMLEQAKARSAGSIWDVPVETMRAGYKDRYYERSVVPAGEVERRRIIVETETGNVPVVVYTPQGLERPLPLVVYLHGGGFVLGDDDAYERQSRNLALGCESIVAFVDYRKAPEARFPTAVDDAIEATRHLLAAPHGHGFDARRVVIMGDSAGGNLAINVASSDIGHAACLLCLLYPVVDLRPYAGRRAPSVSDEVFSIGYGLDFDHMRYFAQHYLPAPVSADDARASPIIRAKLANLPPTLVFSARYDVLFDQAEEYVRLVRSSRGRIEHVIFETMIHNFLGHTNVSFGARDAFSKICSFINRRLIHA